jgi:hypothetical protein
MIRASLLGLVLLTYTVPAVAETATMSGSIPPGGDFVFPLYTVDPGYHLVVGTIGEGNHTCDISEEGVYPTFGHHVRDQDTNASHFCYLNYTVPQDGYRHTFLVRLHNTETHRVGVSITVEKS